VGVAGPGGCGTAGRGTVLASRGAAAPAAMMVLVDERDRVLLLWRHRFVQDRWGGSFPAG
jgi:hypothetical protein